MITIESWTEADVEQIAAIEQRSFSDPWSKTMLADCLRFPAYTCFAAKEGGQVCGYGCLLCLFEEAEIANIAVDAPFRGRGVGKLLLQRMHETAQEKGAQVCLLEVRKSNAAAIALYKSFGYTAYGERKGYYAGGEDAILMRATL